MPPWLPFVLLLTALPGPARAHSETPVYDRVTLDASADAEVHNDLLVAVLFAQSEGRDAAAPADEVNRLVDRALALIQTHPEVKVQTLGYRSSALYDKSSIRGWRVRQALRLESRDSRLLGDLIGELQDALQVQSISYEVSQEERRSHVDQLTATALEQFQRRAMQIAAALGRTGYRIVRLNINDRGQSPVPIARGMVMEAQAAAPVAPARIEAGTQTLSVSVNGEIELHAD